MTDTRGHAVRTIKRTTATTTSDGELSAIMYKTPHRIYYSLPWGSCVRGRATCRRIYSVNIYYVNVLMMDFQRGDT